MLLGPFLTDLDERARVKGSRDPLGVQAIWTHFGRHVVGNLTTVTNSLRDFTAHLLGYYFAERVARENGRGSELETFLKWEQLEAYSRAFFNDDYEFRGTERVKKNLGNGTRITLSTAQSSQILSDQKTYGLWGLYSVSSASSGLVEQNPARLTLDGLEFVEDFYLPRFGEAGIPKANRVVQLLSRDDCRIDLAKAEHSLCTCVARLMKRRVLEHERKFYQFHLVEGGPQNPTEGRQALLAKIMDRVIGRDTAWSPALVRALAKEANRSGQVGESLAYRLERINACEKILAPAASLYAYLQGCHGKTFASAAKRVRDQWGPKVKTINLAEVQDLKTELTASRDEDCADRLVKFAEALSQGEYADALRQLITQNQATMQARGGAAWIEDRAGRLHVRVRDEQGILPTREKISTLWRFPYFLDSLRAISLQLRAT